MSDERAALALERIERAFSRIDRVAGNLQAPPSDNGELLQLRETHDALRGKVEGAISQLDRLLAGARG